MLPQEENEYTSKRLEKLDTLDTLNTNLVNTNNSIDIAINYKKALTLLTEKEDELRELKKENENKVEKHNGKQKISQMRIIDIFIALLCILCLLIYNIMCIIQDK